MGAEQRRHARMQGLTARVLAETQDPSLQLQVGILSCPCSSHQGPVACVC